MEAHNIEPRYVTLRGGQIRLWRTGSGPDLVVLAGLTLAASAIARLVACACPGWRITAIELPGIGGSSEYAWNSLDDVAVAINDVLTECRIGNCALVAFEMAAAVLVPLRARRGETIAASLLIGAKDAAAWASQGRTPPDLTPRQDGTHLTAAWSFIRDCHLLKPDNSSQPAPSGEILPGPEDLDATLTAVAVRSTRFTTLWTLCAATVNRAEGRHITLADLQVALTALDLPRGDAPMPTTTALPGRMLWNDYIDTPRGRMHLRRAGGTGRRPTLVIPTGGGSSAQFEPVITGLAEGGSRQVFAVDYLGNGLSDKPRRNVTIGTLAEDMAAVIRELGFDKVDVWGSHTGALVGLELAVRYPALVGRAVLEGPVFISPDFQSDLLAHYFPPVCADKWGMHIQLIWNWRRDMFMYWPWYRVERDAARQLGVPSAQDLHKYAIGILESGPTYDLAYRSAFSYDTAARLPLLKRPALICAGPNDMLVSGLEDAKRLAIEGVEVRLTPTTIWWPNPDPKLAAETLSLYRAYLDA